MRVLSATGGMEMPPTLAVSSGRGNGDTPEIHLIFREEVGESTRSMMAWFDRDELLTAIYAADNHVKTTLETGEPA